MAVLRVGMMARAPWKRQALPGYGTGSVFERSFDRNETEQTGGVIYKSLLCL
jgi:hypothetical protein